MHAAAALAPLLDHRSFAHIIPRSISPSCNLEPKRTTASLVMSIDGESLLTAFLLPPFRLILGASHLGKDRTYG
ncbi:hypothetical protein RHECNPAF_6420086 [Rhizobium etli CNPAF512]|nr:hypothetical protein RHECNPAF_6420086 [Rhizobium etli CNPAF512]